MIRIGIIGAGVMGADHAQLLSSVVAGATLGGVFDIDADRAAAVAGVGPAARPIDDPHRLIVDADIDAVLVASSDTSHEEFVLACLAAGKPVLCEKPLTPTVAGCRRIVDAEVALDRRLVSVGFMRRHDPGYAAMKHRLDSGEIGSALLVHHVHRNPTAPTDLPSSTVITGSGVHEIDLTRWLLGEEIVAVTVLRPRAARAAGATADPLLLVLESESGVLSDVELFVNAGYGYDVRCELVAESAAITLDAPAALQVRGGFTSGRTIAADWRPRFAEAYRRELQDWIDSIRLGRASASASAWDGLVSTAVAAAGVAALESGLRQEVDLPKPPALYQPISAAQNQPISAAQNQPISAAQNQPISAAQNQPISAAQNQPISATQNQPISATQNQPISATQNQPISATQNQPISATQNQPISATQN